MTCCVSGMGVRGLEEKLVKRTPHAARLESAQATKKAASIFQISWFRRVTCYCLSCAVVQLLGMSVNHDATSLRRPTPRSAAGARASRASGPLHREVRRRLLIVETTYCRGNRWQHG